MRKLILFLFMIIFAGMGHAETESMLARVSLDEATRQILKDGKTRVLGAATETIDGREVHVIKVLTPDGRIHHYKIDAETGASVG